MLSGCVVNVIKLRRMFTILECNPFMALYGLHAMQRIKALHSRLNS